MSILAEIARERRSNAFVPGLRPYKGLINDHEPSFRDRKVRRLSEGDRSKAIEYAEWLAKRDGIELPPFTRYYTKPLVASCHVPLHGFATGVERACFVLFGDVLIEIPHFDYDPTLPPKFSLEPLNS